MITVGLSQRRDITPVNQLERQWTISQHDRHHILQPFRRLRKPLDASRASSGSSAYRLDMGARKLPPPAVLATDAEKDAQLKNRNESNRLTKVTSHLDVQRKVYEGIYRKQAGVVARYGSDFLERAERIKVLRKKEAKLKLHDEDYDELEARDEVRESPSLTIFRKTLYPRRVASAGAPKGVGWLQHSGREDVSVREHNYQSQFSTLHMISETESLDSSISSQSSDANVSDAVGPLVSEQPRTRCVSAHPSLRHGDALRQKLSSNRATSAKHPVTSMTSDEQQVSAIKSRLPDDQTGKRPSVFTSFSAAQDLKKELREIEINRGKCQPLSFDVHKAAEKERRTSASCLRRIKEFCGRLNDFEKRNYSKWELRSLEKELKLA